MIGPWQAFVLLGWLANIIVICGLILTSDPGRVEVSYQLRHSALMAVAPWAVLLEVLSLGLLDG